MFELHAAVAEFGRREAARTGAGPPAMIKYLLVPSMIIIVSF